jgi:putative membrane protein insertion efficiency factor
MTFLHVLRDLPARVLIFCIELYRTYVSPLRLPTCRFAPTCSEYAVEALRTHGALKGSLLACVRLAKCAPWHPGGWNPVPERGSWRAVTHTSTDDIHEFATVDEQRST